MAFEANTLLMENRADLCAFDLIEQNPTMQRHIRCSDARPIANANTICVVNSTCIELISEQFSI